MKLFHDVNFLIISAHVLSSGTEAGFSLNFSSAGKGPFTEGKKRGGEEVEWGTWSEAHGPRPHWEIFLLPYFKTYFMQICCRVIVRQQIKMYIQHVYTVQSKSNARAESGIRSCCATRTCKPPQKAKVLYFCGPFVVYLQELWNERSRKSSPQEATKTQEGVRNSW